MSHESGVKKCEILRDLVIVCGNDCRGCVRCSDASRISGSLGIRYLCNSEHAPTRAAYTHYSKCVLFPNALPAGFI